MLHFEGQLQVTIVSARIPSWYPLPVLSLSGEQ